MALKRPENSKGVLPEEDWGEQNEWTEPHYADKGNHAAMHKDTQSQQLLRRGRIRRFLQQNAAPEN
ncbi:MAG TPA: hypothetical protein VFQ63_01950 [Patescibacteria group bacterium]|nr:hypothetical protein [Patescibacteria group bacterium]